MSFDLENFWSDFKDQSLRQVGLSSNTNVDGSAAAQLVGKALSDFGNKVANPPDGRADPAAVGPQPSSVPVSDQILDREYAGISVKTWSLVAIGLVGLYFVMRKK
jgi:hypothetical protein